MRRFEILSDRNLLFFVCCSGFLYVDMQRSSFVLRKILIRPEIFVYIAIVAFAAAFFALGSSVGTSVDGSVAKHYYRNISEARILWIIVLFLVALFLRGAVLWARAIFTGIEPLSVFSPNTLLHIRSEFLKFLKNVLVIGAPFVIAFYSMTSALGQMNLFNSTRLRDELLFGWDVLLTGTFPPLSLGSFAYPDWFIQGVIGSFMYLVPVFTIFAAYVFLAHQKLFREAAGAFFVGILILFLGWLIFPVMSPHDRFMDNVYDLPIPLSVQAYVDNYVPHQGIAAFLEGMRERKETLSVMPTSTFPSAHVAWAGFLVYYAYRVNRWLAVLALPFAALSSIGTFLLAQHYFVDLPAGILVAVISIWVARWMARKQEQVSGRGARAAI